MLVRYAYVLKMPGNEIIPLVLTAVLASIPVALPATFTLAAAIGARALAKLGVLPTRLSAVDEAASIEVLCADKTGTLTQNELTVTAVHAMSGFDESQYASDEPLWWMNAICRIVELYETSKGFEDGHRAKRVLEECGSATRRERSAGKWGLH